MAALDFNSINSRDHGHSNAGPDGGCGETHGGCIGMFVLKMRVYESVSCVNKNNCDVARDCVNADRLDEWPKHTQRLIVGEKRSCCARRNDSVIVVGEDAENERKGGSWGE